MTKRLNTKNTSVMPKPKGLILAAMTSTMVSLAHAGSLEEGRAALSDNQYHKAIDILAPLADTGDADALYLLGDAFARGAGVQQDWDRAEAYYRAAAEKGNNEAQFRLGIYNLEYDNDAAQKWLEIARANGHPQADFVLNNIIAGQYPDFC